MSATSAISAHGERVRVAVQRAMNEGGPTSALLERLTRLLAAEIALLREAEKDLSALRKRAENGESAQALGPSARDAVIDVASLTANVRSLSTLIAGFGADLARAIDVVLSLSLGGRL